MLAQSLHTRLMAGDSLPIPEAFVRAAGAEEPQGRILCRGAKLRTGGRWVDVCGRGLQAGWEEEMVSTREGVCLPSPWSVSSSFLQKVRPRDKRCCSAGGTGQAPAADAGVMVLPEQPGVCSNLLQR